MSDSIIYVSASQLRHAADLKEKIDNLQHEFEQILGAPSQRTTSQHLRKSGN